MAPLQEAPFFIVGSPRSGTTLLRFILSSHPRIYIPEETGFIPHLRRDVTSPLHLDETHRLLDRIGKLNYLWTGLVTDVPAFYRSLPEPSLAHMIDALYRLQIQPHGAMRWGDKTPLYIRYLHVLDRIFPTAQFIHMIRDGRDATLSAQEKWGRAHFYMDNYYLFKNWVKNIQSGRKAGEWLGPTRYLEVFYEALVSEPNTTVEKICAFLNETFHPGMLDHTHLAKQIGPGPHQHVEVLKPISKESIGRWASHMKPFDRKMAYRLADPTLTALGYAPSNAGSFSIAESLRYILLAFKYLLSSAIRRLLYALGILTLNRTMRRR